jgi:ribosomal protein L34E
MVDEADTIFGTKRVAENNEDVRGVLNAGHQRNRPYVRWDMMTRSREQCPTFAMAMLASIGDLPDTIMDRAIVIRMRRRAPGEPVFPFRSRRDGPALRALGDQLRMWIRANMDTLTAAEPAMPVEDREADTWEPLFAVAELAGGGWQARCRRACLAMTGDEPDDSGIGIRLLADLYAIWETDDYLFTTTILQRLHKVDESPWAEWGRKSEPLTARGLAGLLKAYRVKSRTVRIGGETSKGYARADLTDPWTRYVTSVTASQLSKNPDPTSNDSVTDAVTDSDSQSVTPSNDESVTDSVTDEKSSSVTRSEQRKQPLCDAVTAVTADVRKPDQAALCGDCGRELETPTGIQSGRCEECRRFPTSSTGTEGVAADRIDAW